MTLQQVREVLDRHAGFFDRIREVMDLVREMGPLDLLIYTPAEMDEMLGARHYEVYTRGQAESALTASRRAIALARAALET